MGPTNSFDLPPDLNSKSKNDGGSMIGENAPTGAAGAAGGKAKKKQHHNGDVLFDEFGRYIIEDYDANPPFSDILPVSSCNVMMWL